MSTIIALFYALYACECVCSTVAYLITGSVVMGGAVALVESAINTVAFYFHEKLWNKFDIPELLSHLTVVASHRV
ncbi:DUF2061 domain-containing protein [Leucothrix pacifica]|uniref:DUF2061 domain-containing protein n=1 Tax=Leucothrix pacifica TaxID=1247513 RepID=A0A317CI63_9GAMM|nr:DUF2061 domain-containing protein [Leucothrix pacifica]PWQ97861.1 hypothetical protein DKW60_09285 [Leucothrix pacifica]